MTMPTAGRPKILIVEDESVVAMDLERSLVQLGYQVLGIADTGARALESIERDAPDLVLMDIQLKGEVDGIATADQIRRRWHIPAVFVTANAQDETLARAKASAPYGYLLKPFRAKELNAAILVALHQHRLLRDLFAERTWLRTTMSSLSDGVVATDAEGLVRYLNPAAERLIGCSLNDAVGKPIEEVYILETISGDPLEQCQVRRALAAAAPIGKERFLLRSLAGRTIPIEDSAAPILSANEILGVVTVFLDITDRLRRERKQEAERDRLEEQLQASSEALGQTRTELRALSAHLLTAQEEERRRVSRELHDDLAQRAALAEIRLDQLASSLPRNEGQKALQALRAELVELSTGLREISHRLHPSAIEDLGLERALAAFIQEHRQLGADTFFTARNVPAGLPLPVSTVLYRITQEALRNVIKHAPGSSVRVALKGKDDELHLTIEDTGPGFDLAAVRGQRGLGLLSMQERARLVGGSLVVRTGPGDGTLLVVRVPVSGI